MLCGAAFPTLTFPRLWQTATNKIKQVPRSLFPTPDAFVFLFGSCRFLTFQDSHVFVWDYNGKLVTQYVVADHRSDGLLGMTQCFGVYRFDNVQLFHKECNSSNMQVTKGQDFIVTVSRSPRTGRRTCTPAWVCAPEKGAVASPVALGMPNSDSECVRPAHRQVCRGTWDRRQLRWHDAGPRERDGPALR